MAVEPNGPVEPEERLTTQDARAGKTGVGVRYVLAASLALTVIGMLVVLFVFGWRPATP
jgi:hypothetical protein